jgi:hypothetical protein
MLRSITVEDVMRAGPRPGPCEAYPREIVEGLFAGRPYATARDVLELRIPWRDKIWVIHHCDLVPLLKLEGFFSLDADRQEMRIRDYLALQEERAKAVA